MNRRTHKYNATKSVCAAGHTHDSRKESRRCADLHLLARAGQISDLRVQEQYWFVIDGRQVKMDNGRRAGIKVDFRYIENGREVVEDVKGMVVRDWPLRKAIFKALYPDLIFRET